MISETLRLYPATWLVTRTVTQDTMLGGVHLAAGTTLAYSSYLIHHTSDVYPDPGRFDPDRWQSAPPDRSEYIPFGAGAAPASASAIDSARPRPSWHLPRSLLSGACPPGRAARSGPPPWAARSPAPAANAANRALTGETAAQAVGTALRRAAA